MRGPHVINHNIGGGQEMPRPAAHTAVVVFPNLYFTPPRTKYLRKMACPSEARIPASRVTVTTGEGLAARRRLHVTQSARSHLREWTDRGGLPMLNPQRRRLIMGGGTRRSGPRGVPGRALAGPDRIYPRVASGERASERTLWTAMSDAPSRLRVA